MKSAAATEASLAQLTSQQSAMLGHVDHFLAVTVLGALALAVIGLQRVFR